MVRIIPNPHSTSRNRVGAVILAAGASTRLGTPKQLLTIDGRSLLRRTTEETLAAGCRPVIVVLGACLEPAIRELSGLPVQVVENQGWSEGMGSSIRAGLDALDARGGAGGLEGVLLAVCDQPHYSAELVMSLIEAFERGEGGVAACEYGGRLGVPAVFAASLFPDLRALRGDEGARKVLRANSAAVRSVPFPAGAVDVDTPEDYDRLRLPADPGGVPCRRAAATPGDALRPARHHDPAPRG